MKVIKQPQLKKQKQKQKQKNKKKQFIWFLIFQNSLLINGRKDQGTCLFNFKFVVSEAKISSAVATNLAGMKTVLGILNIIDSSIRSKH